MKNVLPIMFCLLGYSTTFAQVEIKGFLEGRYFQYDILMEEDSSYLFQDEKSLSLRPSFALSFYRINRAFHEFGIANIYINNKNYDQKNGVTTLQTKTNQTNFDFRYNYNYCILKESKRWQPYVGIQTNHHFGISRSEQGANQMRGLNISSQAGLAAGVQYKIKDKFRLELQMPIDLVYFRYQRQNTVNSQAPNGRIRQFVDMNWIENPFVMIPFRVGVAVQI